MNRLAAINFLRRKADLALFGNIFIAAGAVCQGMLTYLLLGTPAQPKVIALLFFSTLAVYTLGITRFYSTVPQGDGSSRENFITVRQSFLKVLFIVAAALSVPLVFTLKMQSFCVVVVLAAVSLLYLKSLIPYRAGRISLREVPGIKSLIISLIWAVSTVWLPVYEAGAIVSPARWVTLLLSRFFLVFAASIAFDIRDIARDRLSGIKSIPVLFWPAYSRLLSAGILVVDAGFLSIGGLADGTLSAFRFALVGSLAIQIVLVLITTPERSDYFFFFGLDGIFILQYVLVYCCSILNR